MVDIIDKLSHSIPGLSWTDAMPGYLVRDKAFGQKEMDVLVNVCSCAPPLCTSTIFFAPVVLLTPPPSFPHLNPLLQHFRSLLEPIREAMDNSTEFPYVYYSSKQKSAIMSKLSSQKNIEAAIKAVANGEARTGGRGGGRGGGGGKS